VDIADLKEILRILEEQDITEFELEQDGVKLRVCRAAGRPVAVVGAGELSDPPAPAVAVLGASLPGASTTADPAGANATPAAEADAGGSVVKSPIVGTFYRAPDPNSAPFVDVGDRVRVGQVLCIIEAMKLMNEIEAEMAGEVLKVHVENGQPVQYGDPLFTLRPA
jgi:acetyl-CoA carboxylase biotin carboxyl carrier protein